MPRPISPTDYQQPPQGENTTPALVPVGRPAAVGKYRTQVVVDHFGTVSVQVYQEGSGVGIDVSGRRSISLPDSLGEILVSASGVKPTLNPGVDGAKVAEALRLASNTETCPSAFRIALRSAASGLELDVDVSSGGVRAVRQR